MKILWIGTLDWYDRDKGYLYPAIEAGIVSASSFQQAMIEGIEKKGNKVQIVSDWGNHDGKRKEWSHNSSSKDILVKCISTRYVRLLIKSFTLYREIKKNNELLIETDCVVIYGVHIPYLFVANAIRNLNTRIKLVLVCPDLAEYMDPSIGKKPIKKLLKKVESFYVHNVVSIFHGVVWFAPLMREVLKVKKDTKEIIIEGIASNVNINIVEKKEMNEKKYVLYAGSLNSNFGIQNILEAFNMINDNDIKLLIFGSGELESYIRNIAKQKSNIEYGGMISRDELFEYEKSAFLLINARNPEEPFTFYSFPSKMLEYMASGTPVLTTKLKGFPKEYDDYLFYLKDNSPSTIAKTIEKISEMESNQLNAFGKKAQHFILTNKNADVQSEKMSNFLNSLCNE
jgi:glycosyltransferase involved in cell wall biosynthesis